MHKVKRFFLVISLLSAFFVNVADAACVASGSNWITTPDYESVSSCVSKADPEDIINVTAGTGSAIWASTLTITKGINLIGPGRSKLSITLSGNPGIYYNPDYSKDYAFRLSGFTFVGNPSYTMMELGSNYFTVVPGSSDKQTKIRIDSNNFSNSTSGGPLIWLHNGMFGVIDYNILTTGNYVFRATHLGATAGEWTYWGYYPGMEAHTRHGHGDSIYIENNTIGMTSTTSSNIIISSQNSMRWVLRYNNISVASSTWSYLDIHGNQSGSNFHAPQGVEVYGNNVNGGSNYGRFMDHRGGQLMMYNNNFTTSSGSSIEVQTREEYPDTNQTPSSNKITGQPQHVWKSYYWNNRKNYTGPTFSYTLGERVGDVPLDNRDYWKDTSWVQSSSGVGKGSSLPAGNCTMGVGFWLTSQSVSDLTNYVGANPTASISGSLYVCSGSNTWVKYYTPFTYPHPLATGGSPSPPPPPVVPNHPVILELK